MNCTGDRVGRAQTAGLSLGGVRPHGGAPLSLSLSLTLSLSLSLSRALSLSLSRTHGGTHAHVTRDPSIHAHHATPERKRAHAIKHACA